jgi:hypothetical protein
MRQFWQLLAILNLALMPAMAAPHPHNSVTAKTAAPKSAGGIAQPDRAKDAGLASEMSALQVEVGELRELLTGQTSLLQEQG